MRAARRKTQKLETVLSMESSARRECSVIDDEPKTEDWWCCCKLYIFLSLPISVILVYRGSFFWRKSNQGITFSRFHIVYVESCDQRFGFHSTICSIILHCFLELNMWISCAEPNRIRIFQDGHACFIKNIFSPKLWITVRTFNKLVFCMQCWIDRVITLLKWTEYLYPWSIFQNQSALSTTSIIFN